MPSVTADSLAPVALIFIVVFIGLAASILRPRRRNRPRAPHYHTSRSFRTSLRPDGEQSATPSPMDPAE